MLGTFSLTNEPPPSAGDNDPETKTKNRLSVFVGTEVYKLPITVLGRGANKDSLVV